jgi:hypothetical protein
MPDWIPTRPFVVSTRDAPRKRREIRVPLVNDELALLWMVNMGCIDMNTWYSRVDKPDRPDFVLFDLDPSADVGFKEAVEVAHLVREVLAALDLESYAKTSGADGMHVLLPIARRYTYAETREFAEIVAGTIARSHRGLVTTEWSKQRRRCESKRRGEDDRVCLFGEAPARRAGVDAAPLGRADDRPRPTRLHDGGRTRACGARRRSLRARSQGPPIARGGAQEAFLGAL